MPFAPEPLWRRLRERLWHATDRVGLEGILSSGDIRASVGDRYEGAFSRKIGAVSLFDFGPTATCAKERYSDWSGWFGSQQRQRYSVWLEIDRAGIGERLFDAAAARTEWHRNGPGLFISGVEACHSGAIATELIVGTLLVARDNLELFHRIDGPLTVAMNSLDAFELRLPPEVQDPLVDALLAGRDRVARAVRKAD